MIPNYVVANFHYDILAHCANCKEYRYDRYSHFFYDIAVNEAKLAAI